MRLLLGLILWVGTPFYWFGTIANGTFQPAVGILMALFALGMAAGEWTRYQRRQHR